MCIYVKSVLTHIAMQVFHHNVESEVMHTFGLSVSRLRRYNLHRHNIIMNLSNQNQHRSLKTGFSNRCNRKPLVIYRSHLNSKRCDIPPIFMAL